MFTSIVSNNCNIIDKITLPFEIEKSKIIFE